LVLHVAAEELSLIVDRLRTRWRWTTPHNEREVGDFERCFQRDYIDTRTAMLLYYPLCSTRPLFITQPIVPQLPSRQGAPTPYLQQSTTTSCETATHMCIRLISPKSVGLELIVSVHFTQDRHNTVKFTVTIQYVTSYCNQNYLLQC